MDLGPDLKEAVWLFTYGQPSDGVLAMCEKLLAGGRMDWLIVPLPIDGPVEL